MPEERLANPYAAERAAIVVRPAGVEDAARLGEIHTLGWQSAYRGIVPDTYLDTLDTETAAGRWRQRLAEPPEPLTCLVAQIDGEAAAFAVGGRYRIQQDAPPEDTHDWGELQAIYTHPTLRGRGAGTAVHDSLLRVLANQGWRVAALWVLRDNAASRSWYAARGWCPDGAVSQWLGAGAPLEEVRLVRPLSRPL